MTVLRSSQSRRGFSLIELLTVIAIIGVLAGIAVGLTAGARNARVNSRAQTELRQVQTAIEAYHADRNAFPPDHRLPEGSLQKVDPVVNQLYYELRGVEVVRNGFRARGQQEVLTAEAVKEAFGRGGFLNASADASEPARTYLEPKTSMVASNRVGNTTVELLVTPFPWPRSAPEPAPLSPYDARNFANPWRYVSTTPTNSPGRFDLWAEVWVGSNKRVFKNW